MGTLSKINGCVITDCGSASGFFVNCVECFGLIIDVVSNPREFKDYIDKYDIFFINATIASLRIIPELKSKNKKIAIILECSGQFWDQQYIEQERYDLISQSDFILAQFGHPYVNIIKQIYSKDIYFYGVPANIDYLQKVSEASKKRKKFIHVRTLDTKNFQLNAQANFALCNILQEQYDGEIEFITPSADKLIRKKLGNVTVIGIVSQSKHWELLASCELCIDMSRRITWGRYFIESCALKTPYIGSYCGAADLSGINTFDCSDINSACDFARYLLEDNNIYIKTQDENLKKIQIVSPQNQLKKLVTILKGVSSEN